ncbi:hypothetical protein ABBQ38_003696 [Trebouxia sp. C0009 RCD-2024]
MSIERVSMKPSFRPGRQTLNEVQAQSAECTRAELEKLTSTPAYKAWRKQQLRARKVAHVWRIGAWSLFICIVWCVVGPLGTRNSVHQHQAPQVGTLSVYDFLVREHQQETSKDAWELEQQAAVSKTSPWEQPPFSPIGQAKQECDMVFDQSQTAIAITDVVQDGMSWSTGMEGGLSVASIHAHSPTT